ncbi:MAG: hypothetical protein ACRD4S_16955 [Candidatus Acidiferrales bacterium]
MDGTIRLDGREFTGISQALTAAQDDYLLAHLRVAGVIEILDSMGNTPREKLSEEMLTRIMLSGETHAILAGALTESGKQWSRAEAERNRAAFAAVTDAAEKTAMRTAIVSFVIGFFGFGEPSSTSSPRSSSPAETARPTANEEAATSASSAR